MQISFKKHANCGLKQTNFWIEYVKLWQKQHILKLYLTNQKVKIQLLRYLFFLPLVHTMGPNTGCMKTNHSLSKGFIYLFVYCFKHWT